MTVFNLQAKRPRFTLFAKKQSQDALRRTAPVPGRACLQVGERAFGSARAWDLPPTFRKGYRKAPAFFPIAIAGR